MTTLALPAPGPVTITPVRNVRLYGKLGAKFGRSFRLAVSSPAEAMQALISQLPGLESFLVQSKDMGLGYAVFAGKRNLREDQLTYPVGRDDIRIAPVILGSKNSGWLNVILGAVLIVAGVFVAAMEFTVMGGVTAGQIGGYMIGAGIAMMAGGVVQLLMPQPKMQKPKERAEDTPSYSFNGAVNTMAQGHPVPLLYGRLIVGSAVASAGIEAKDEVYVPNDTVADPPSGGGGGGGGDRGDQRDYREEM